MALGCWRTGSLNSHGEHHFANRRAAARGLQTTGLINESDQIQLLSDPYQGTDVADQSRPDGTGRSQVGHRGWICRAQHGLSRERPLLGGIPQRLGSDPIPTPTHLALEYVNSFRSERPPGLDLPSPTRPVARTAAAWRDPTTTGKRSDTDAHPPGARIC